MKMVRLCLVGAGRWGMRYIDTIATLDGVELTALATRTAESLATAPPGCQTFLDWRRAVEQVEADGVIVATPPALHADVALFSLGSARPVLIEKPLALDLASADRVLRASEQAGTFAMVGHTQVFNPGFDALRRALPQIGAVRHITCVGGAYGPFRRDVTPLWDWAPHDLAMCLVLMGGQPEVTAATCSAKERIDGGEAATYLLELRFGADVTGHIHIGNLMDHKQRIVTVEGAEGRLILDDIASTLTLEKAGSRHRLPFAAERPLTRQVRIFAEAIRNEVRIDSSLSLGRDVVAIMSRCEELLRGGDVARSA